MADNDRQARLLHRYIEATVIEYNGPMGAGEVSNILKALTVAMAYFARQAKIDPQKIMEQCPLILGDALKISDAKVKELTEVVWRRIRKVENL